MHATILTLPSVMKLICMLCVADISADDVPCSQLVAVGGSKVVSGRKRGKNCQQVSALPAKVPKKVDKQHKRRWPMGDLELLLKTFGKNIVCKKMPLTAELLSFISLLSQPRSLAQVRAQVHNYVSGKIRH